MSEDAQRRPDDLVQIRAQCQEADLEEIPRDLEGTQFLRAGTDGGVHGLDRYVRAARLRR